MNNEIQCLQEMQNHGGKRQTLGLENEVLTQFMEVDERLKMAINRAYEKFNELQLDDASRALLELNEKELIAELTSNIVNFYAETSVNPYVPLAAVGPWIVTSKGAVLHDSGGYGMLGFGHNPHGIMKSLQNDNVMANIMTASFSHKRTIQALNEEIGQTREKGGQPIYRYMFLNSGSEANTLSMRISDINALMKRLSSEAQSFKDTKYLSLVGSFHGRTDKPGRISDSCQKVYQENLYSYQHTDKLMTVPANDIAALEKAFEQAREDNVFIESMFLEPVLGEGCPGLAITPEFYQRARELTKENGSLLVVDSIQAGFRATGYLSIVDYPGFSLLPPPDIEVFSKALNGGQFPLSLIGVRPEISDLYKIGVYGNTMTANPRAMDVIYAVLETMTDSIRQNISSMGTEMLKRFQQLKDKYPEIIQSVQGQGLLLALEINPQKGLVTGDDNLEFVLRQKGIGVIHGGKNALRFTPVFAITKEEINLIIDKLDQVFTSI